MRSILRHEWPLLVVIVLMVILLCLALWGGAARSAPTGPTGLTTTTVNMPSGRMVECVLARDASPAGLSVAVDCDFGR